MRLFVVPLGPPLEAYVEAFWFVRGRPDYSGEKVLPNGVVELIFNLGAPHKVIESDDGTRFRTFFDTWLAGLQERYLVIEAVDDFDLVGIRFRPGGATPFLRSSPAELTNNVVECGDFDPALASLAAAVRDRLRTPAPPPIASPCSSSCCARGLIRIGRAILLWSARSATCADRSARHWAC